MNHWIKKLIKLSDECENRGRYEDALRIYNIIEKRGENDGELLSLINAFRGRVKKISGDMTGALMCYDKAIFYSPLSPNALFNRAMVRYELGMISDALDDLNKSISIQPKPDSYLMRAMICEQNGNYNDAINECNLCLQCDREYDKAYFRLGVLYYRIRELNKSVECYKNYIALQPEDPDGYYNIALVFEDLFDYDNAIKYYNHSIEIDSNNYDAVYNRAKIFIKMNYLPEAKKDLHNIIINSNIKELIDLSKKTLSSINKDG